MREQGSSFVQNDITRNAWVWGALVLCILLLLAAVYVPFLSSILQVIDPGVEGWALVLGMSLIVWVVGSILKQFQAE
jgi:Ca2+-transporting ATPase